MQHISDINTATKEGRLLFAALAIMTSSESVTINGQPVRGSATHPDDMLQKVQAVAAVLFEDQAGPKPETPKEPLPFRQELERLINRHSMENGSNTPDFVLAEYLIGCLDLFNQTSRAREKWFGQSLTIG